MVRPRPGAETGLTTFVAGDLRVCFGSEADIDRIAANVRFGPEAGHKR